MEGNFISHLLEGALPQGIPFWALSLVAALAGALLVAVFVSILALVSVWLERKLAGHIQARLGPMRTGGWHGWSQTLADAIKLLTKEDILPSGADPVLFRLAPALVMGSALAMFAVLPFAPGIQFADLDLGIYFLLAIASLTTIGGLTPLAFFATGQANFLSPMAKGIVFGMTTATLMTLLLVPAGILVLEDVKGFFRRRRFSESRKAA